MLFSIETLENRPGKSCKSSTSRKFRDLQCPQNSRICVNGVAWWNPQTLMVYPQPIALHPQFLILNALFSKLFDPTSFLPLWAKKNTPIWACAAQPSAYVSTNLGILELPWINQQCLTFQEIANHQKCRAKSFAVIFCHVYFACNCWEFHFLL